MKTSLMKQVIPVAVFVLAIAGAFTTHAMNENSKTFTIVPGYVRLYPDGSECEQQDDCSPVGNGYICTVAYEDDAPQLWGKNSADQCTVPVYRP